MRKRSGIVIEDRPPRQQAAGGSIRLRFDRPFVIARFEPCSEVATIRARPGLVSGHGPEAAIPPFAAIVAA
jgi:hypothetical protein